MDKFVTLTAIAAPINMDNVDNDQVIPARYLKVARAEGDEVIVGRDLMEI